MLEHPWFQMADNYDYKMSEMEQKLYELKDHTQIINNYSADPGFVAETKADLVN